MEMYDNCMDDSTLPHLVSWRDTAITALLSVDKGQVSMLIVNLHLPVS